MSKPVANLGLKDFRNSGTPVTIIMVVVFLALFNFVTPNCALAADIETNGSGGVHEIVAGLSDEQVRRLLIDELQKAGSYTKDDGTSLISKGIFSGLLARLENFTGVLYWRISAFVSSHLTNERSTKKRLNGVFPF